MTTSHFCKSARHTTHYLAAGPEDGPVMIFVHGWPELAYSWRNQLPFFAAQGYRVVAPDMRGYGQSSTYPSDADFRLEETVADMCELLEHLGADEAIWVGHDWGAPVVWAMAQQHPEKCRAVASLCVPYIPEGLELEVLKGLVNRDIYPEAAFPYGQWEYVQYYAENFEGVVGAFDADVSASVRALFRAGDPKAVAQPAPTAFVRKMGGWFGGGPAPSLPRDDRVISADAEAVYTEALSKMGFGAPGRWYMNGPANMAFAETVKDNWQLTMPTLFLHGAYDAICETVNSKLADPMRHWCSNLTEQTLETGHWMAQEKPDDVNAALLAWLDASVTAKA
ncbi:MAG: alpha/beta hydrolase [Rhodobacteraceae bacterium]|nr:alpha/beta hydrolase [Paracoccaceae bacterium]